MRSVYPASVLGLILAVYLALGLGNIATRSPWCDEAWFGSPAYNLAYKGFMGTTVLDPASSTWKSVRLTGIDRHTYWVLPLSLLLNAGVFRTFGFQIDAMRAMSLLWGLVALAAWWVILRKLTGAGHAALPGAALAGLALIAVDYHFLLRATEGRMDMMCLALGYAGIASYLVLRERNLLAAIAASHVLTAASVFTHPNGALLEILLICTILYYDRQRIRIQALVVAALPYLVAAAGWGLYIAHSPGDFAIQFLGNASNRGPTILTPLAALKLEISHRYMDSFGLAAWSYGIGRINVLPLAMYLAGVAGCALVPPIRRHPGYRLLLVWTFITMFYLTMLEGLKTPYYLNYVTPLFAVLLAVLGCWLWSERPHWRIAMGAGLAVMVCLQVLRTAVNIHRDPRHNSYLPAVRYLQTHAGPRTFIMGSAELIFGLGPDWNVLDDVRLGYNTGKRPELVVMEERYEDNMLMLKDIAPPIFTHVTGLLAGEYREVYRYAAYRILARIPPGGAR